MITDRIRRHGVLLSINHKSYNFREKKNSQVMNERPGEISIKRLTKEGMKLFNVAVKLRLVDLKYNFECDWFIQLSDNKLSDNNLASELVENRSFLNQSQSKKL